MTSGEYCEKRYPIGLNPRCDLVDVTEADDAGAGCGEQTDFSPAPPALVPASASSARPPRCKPDGEFPGKKSLSTSTAKMGEKLYVSLVPKPPFSSVAEIGSLSRSDVPCAPPSPPG